MKIEEEENCIYILACHCMHMSAVSSSNVRIWVMHISAYVTFYLPTEKDIKVCDDLSNVVIMSLAISGCEYKLKCQIIVC